MLFFAQVLPFACLQVRQEQQQQQLRRA